MTSNELLEIIKYHAENYNIPPNILYGICMQESNMQIYACRYEPNYKWLFTPEKVKPKLCSTQTEEIFQKISWGVGQVMGAVLRELGYTDWLPAILSDKNAQIMYGAKHLANLKKRFPNGNDYISAYNQGSPRKTVSGRYVNNEYVSNVLKFSKEFES